MTPTETVTLAGFILQRIAEDEADAKLAMEEDLKTGHWTRDGGSIYDGHPMNEVVDWVYGQAWAHIARHDPARVLAECEAKRRIVEDMSFYWRKYPEGLAARELAERTLANLALPYADHPDYREEWKL